MSSFGQFILLISGEKVTPVCCPRSWVGFFSFFPKYGMLQVSKKR
jgi:hypothetical protein